MPEQNRRFSFSSNRNSIRGNYPSRRPSNGGSSSEPRNFSNRPRNNDNSSNSQGFSRNRTFRKRPQSQLAGHPEIFIKAASPITPESIETTHKSFAEFDLAAILKSNIEYKKYTQPTPIQDQAIQSILDGRDVIGLANTGTGKTAAFLIPLIDKMFKTRDQRTLIIAPTRELAVQINEEFRDFAYDMKLYSALVIGGANISRQIHDMRRNPHVVIATPGRLKDLIERKVIYLEDYKNIVLDEVDLMVDIGFINEVKYFISLMPEDRQSLFFSATIAPKIRTILEAFVKNPVTVSVKQQDTSGNVEQDVIRVTQKDKKIDQLHDLLIKDGFDKVLIFGQTKHGIEKLYNELVFRGFKAGAIHGNKKQGQRQRVLESFKKSEIQILLATDVASRGLDINNVSHVINYDLPETYEDYVHRIGRTGRAGKSGTALTFVDA